MRSVQVLAPGVPEYKWLSKQASVRGSAQTEQHFICSFSQESLLCVEFIGFLKGSINFHVQQN